MEIKDKKASRTFTMTDGEYRSISDLAERKRMTRTQLLLLLVEQETKRLDDQV